MNAISSIVDHNAPVSKFFALNAAVASEAYDATLFNTAPNNPLVHSEWIEYRVESWSAYWHQFFPPGDDRRKLTWRDRFASVATKTQLYNYYSSGDEVLEIGEQGISLLDDVNLIAWNFGRHSWHKQEIFKGRNILYGTGVGGWGFESNVTATAVATVPLSVLRDTPIFEKGYSEMYSSVITNSMQNKILGYSIPALSEPLGRKQMNLINVKSNINMNSYKSNEWCRCDDDYEDDWLHSDIQNAAFYYTYRIYDKIVEEGGL